MTISNRTEYEAALKRHADLRREAGSDPAKHREYSELSTDLDTYRRNNPQAGREQTAREQPGREPGRESGGREPGREPRRENGERDPRTGAYPPDYSGQSDFDPHNQNNVKEAPPDESGGAPSPTPTPEPTPEPKR